MREHLQPGQFPEHYGAFGDLDPPAPRLRDALFSPLAIVSSMVTAVSDSLVAWARKKIHGEPLVNIDTVITQMEGTIPGEVLDRIAIEREVREMYKYPPHG